MKFVKRDRVIVVGDRELYAKKGEVMDARGMSIVVLLDGEESPAKRTWHIPADALELDPAYERPAAARLPDEFDAAAVALGITREAVQADMAKVFAIPDDAVILDAEGYESLARVLARAFSQAAHGKGKERHAQGQAFDCQPMQALCDLYGPGFALGQAAKKTQEARRLEHGPAIRELLGAINYVAGAVIAMERHHREGAAHG